MKAEWTNKDVLTQSETTGQSKSILVIDTPSCCFDCPLLREGIVDTCLPLDRSIHDEEGGFDEDDNDRPSWCPLKPLPKKKIATSNSKVETSFEYVHGFNDCIRAITGDTE